mgnify:CR=1 FL=1
MDSSNYRNTRFLRNRQSHLPNREKLDQINSVDIAKVQREDPALSIEYYGMWTVIQNRLLRTESRSLLQWENSSEKVRKLCSVNSTWRGKQVSCISQQIVLPIQYRWSVYCKLHKEMGHLGTERMFTLAKERFFWPDVKADIDQYINHACRCQKQKKPSLYAKEHRFGRVWIHTLLSSTILQDTCGRTLLKVSRAKQTYNKFVPLFGYPSRVHHDKGRVGE